MIGGQLPLRDRLISEAVRQYFSHHVYGRELLGRINAGTLALDADAKRVIRAIFQSLRMAVN